MTQTPQFDLTGFEEFDGYGRKRRSVPTIAIQARGALSMNGTAYEEMGRPEFVKLMFNRQTGQIAIQTVKETDLKAVKARPSGNATSGGGVVFGSKSFLDAYNLPYDTYKPLEVLHLAAGLAVAQVPTGDDGERQ